MAFQIYDFQAFSTTMWILWTTNQQTIERMRQPINSENALRFETGTALVIYVQTKKKNVLFIFCWGKNNGILSKNKLVVFSLTFVRDAVLSYSSKLAGERKKNQSFKKKKIQTNQDSADRRKTETLTLWIMPAEWIYWNKEQSRHLSICSID